MRLDVIGPLLGALAGLGLGVALSVLWLASTEPSPAPAPMTCTPELLVQRMPQCHVVCDA